MKNIISIIAAFILVIAVISCGGNKETNQSEQNTQTNQTSQSQNIQTNTLVNQSKQTNNQKELFDMKYVYKGIRADKIKFDEKLNIVVASSKYIAVPLISHIEVTKGTLLVVGSFFSFTNKKGRDKPIKTIPKNIYFTIS